MNEKELSKILEDHKLWLNYKVGGRANLRGSNLHCADLSSADLHFADLRSANLQCADLRSADLHCADLNSADLRGADLRSADLHCADLRGANLRSADLHCADLRGANLHCAGFIEIRTDIWTAQIHIDSVRIGCQHHTHEEWLSFSDDEINKMESRALDWWKTWKPAIVVAIEAVKSQKCG